LPVFGARRATFANNAKIQNFTLVEYLGADTKIPKGVGRRTLLRRPIQAPIYLGARWPLKIETSILQGFLERILISAWLEVTNSL
jgi:hypothetical protein